MTSKTLREALSILDVQKHYMNDGDEVSVKVQSAYYDGMRRMLELIVSEAYTDNTFVIVEDGKHKILA
jgi:hypothetical protein